MTIDVRLPTPLLSHVTTWGNPYHGRMDWVAQVRDSVFPKQRYDVKLPTGETHQVTIPQQAFTGGASLRDAVFRGYLGSNRVFKRADIPPIDRSPAQLADDAAHGREWRDYAIMHPVTNSLYRPAGGGWVWCDAGGKRWLVNPEWSAAAETLVVTLTRYGALGAPATTYSKELTFTAAGTGQSSPAIEGIGLVSLRWHSSTKAGDRTVLRFEAAWQDYVGDKAVDRVVKLHTGVDTDLQYKPSLPLGFIELALTGEPGGQASAWSASVTVRATRSQCLGTSSVQTWEPDKEIVLGVATVSTPPTGSVTTVQTITSTDDFYDSLLGSNWLKKGVLTIGKTGYQMDFQDRVISVHFEGETDELTTVSLDFMRAKWIFRKYEQTELDFVAYFSRSTSGQLQLVSAPDVAYTLDHSVELADFTECAIKKNGGVLTTIRTGRSGVFSELRAGVWRSAFAPGSIVLNPYFITEISSRELSLVGTKYNLTSEEPYILPYWTPGNNNGGFGGFGPPPAMTPAEAAWLPFVVDMVGGIAVMMPYATDCYGYILQEETRLPNGGDYVTKFGIGPTVTPSGVVPAVPLGVYEASSPPPIFGSHNPVSGEFLRSTSPVNWV